MSFYDLQSLRKREDIDHMIAVADLLHKLYSEVPLCYLNRHLLDWSTCVADIPPHARCMVFGARSHTDSRPASHQSYSNKVNPRKHEDC